MAAKARPAPEIHTEDVSPSFGRRRPRYEHRTRDWAEGSTHCPKCGFDGSMEHGLMRWWRPVYIADHLAPGMAGRDRECLLVKCKVCAYAWTEDVLEAEIPPN